MKLILAHDAIAAVWLAAGARASICKPSTALQNSIQFGVTTTANFPSTISPHSVYPSVFTTRLDSVGEEPKTIRRFTSEAVDGGYGIDSGAISALVSTIPQNSDLTRTGLLHQSTTSTSEFRHSNSRGENLVPDASTDVTSRASVVEDGPTMSEPTAIICTNGLSHICGEKGLLLNGQGNLIKLFRQYDLAQCKRECENTENCLAIGFTTGKQCELYDAKIYDMSFEKKDWWYFSVYDNFCSGVDAA